MTGNLYFLNNIMTRETISYKEDGLSGIFYKVVYVSLVIILGKHIHTVFFNSRIKIGVVQTTT